MPSHHDEIAELQLDLAELKQLHAQATRRKNKTFLNNQIAILENKIENAQPIASAVILSGGTNKGTTSSSSTTTASSASVSLLPIMSYSFDQTETQVTIYIHLKGVNPEKTQTELTCTEQSFDLKVFNVNSSEATDAAAAAAAVLKNYRLQISKTDGTIDKDQSKVRVKKDQLVLTLKKTSDRHWLQLPYRKLVGEDFDPETDDPGSGLVGMMRQLYDEGDEDMKRTIAKTWSKTEKQNKYAFPSKKHMMRN